MLVRPKKGPHFVLVEESGTNTNSEKNRKNTPQKKGSHKTNENLHNFNETN